jgi:hypothetical protein
MVYCKGTLLHEVTSILLSSSDNLITGSAGVKRQAGKGRSTAHAAPTFVSPFQKHCLGNWHDSAVSLKQWSEVECQTFLTKLFTAERDLITRVIEHCDKGRHCIPTPNRIDVFRTGIILPCRAVPCRCEQSNVRTVPTTAVCSVRELRSQVV